MEKTHTVPPWTQAIYLPKGAGAWRMEWSDTIKKTRVGFGFETIRGVGGYDVFIFCSVPVEGRPDLKDKLAVCDMSREGVEASYKRIQELALRLLNL